jgi:hypothetical protein
MWNHSERRTVERRTVLSHARPVVMPQLGESVAEGTVIEWLKQEGSASRRTK